MPRNALWSELLPLEIVRDPATLRLVARFGLELRLACFAETTSFDELALTLERARAHDVEVALWPMLSNDEGRWASAHNGEAFARNARRVIAEMRARSCAVRALMVDIEPPIDVMSRWLARAKARVPRRTDGAATPSVPEIEQRLEGDRALVALFDELIDEGVRVGAAVVPTHVLGGTVGRGLEWLLGLPNDDVAYEPASSMLYSSMMEGYSRGWISRMRAKSLLERGAKRAVSRFGSRAEISLGVVGTGALGDEPTYRDVRELHEDVEIARSAGVSRLALFDLRGVLERSSPEAWLEALTS
ncbi:MAG: hypothetical protein JNK05_28015 [Myxococcales bacterium]|nr:hypothetical protein [Myxococcales bacterium]